MNKGYLIIEMNTRAIDGWYYNLKEAKEIFEYCKTEYPKGSWTLAKGIYSSRIIKPFRKYYDVLEHLK
jgi:hypothetical protein